MNRDELENALTGLGLEVSERSLSSLDAENSAARVVCSFASKLRGELKRLSVSLFTRHPRGFWEHKATLEGVTSAVALEEFRAYCKPEEGASE